MPYRIKEIAKLAGVTTRTLRYYDTIGLLKPAEIGSNGYRYYNRENLFELQQILFFREMEIPLDEIRRIMLQPDFNVMDAMENHQIELHKRMKRLAALINTVEQTIQSIKGERQMTEQELFEGFDEAVYEDEARERWGNTSEYIESRKKWAGYSKDQKEKIKEEGLHFIERLAGKGSDGKPADGDVQAAIGEYLAYLNRYFYTCDAKFLRNLSDM